MIVYALVPEYIMRYICLYVKQALKLYNEIGTNAYTTIFTMIIEHYDSSPLRATTSLLGLLSWLGTTPDFYCCGLPYGRIKTPYSMQVSLGPEGPNNNEVTKINI